MSKIQDTNYWIVSNSNKTKKTAVWNCVHYLVQDSLVPQVRTSLKHLFQLCYIACSFLLPQQIHLKNKWAGIMIVYEIQRLKEWHFTKMPRGILGIVCNSNNNDGE